MNGGEKVVKKKSRAMLDMLSYSTIYLLRHATLLLNFM